MSNAEPPNAPGASRYDVLFDLATGGMGKVAVARQRGSAGFQRLVALKTIHRSLAADEQFQQMFLEEARLASAIHHPNVVQVTDLGEMDGTYFLAMEYVPGEPLSRLMEMCKASGSRVPFAIATRLLIDACAGLHAAHELRDPDGRLLDLVHRDISPSNLLVTEHGICKLTDFGIAKALTGRNETTAGTLRGKAAYLSPEQVIGERPDRRSDVFALGVVLFELTTLEKLFTGQGHVQVLEAVSRCEIPDPRAVVPDYPDALADVLTVALSRDRRRRYATAEAMGSALERAHLGFDTPALSADVAAFVRETLGDVMQARKVRIADALRAIEGTTPAPPDRSSRVSAAPKPAAVTASIEMPGAVPTETVTHRMPTPARAVEPPVQPITEDSHSPTPAAIARETRSLRARRRRVSWVGLATGAAILSLVAALTLGPAMSRRGSAARPTAAPVSAPLVPATAPTPPVTTPIGNPAPTPAPPTTPMRTTTVAPTHSARVIHRTAPVARPAPRPTVHATPPPHTNPALHTHPAATGFRPAEP